MLDPRIAAPRVSTTYPWPLLATLASTGLGLFAVPFFTTALHEVRPHETGSAAGLLNAVQQPGGTLGIALLGSIFLHTLTTAGPADPATAALDAAQHACWVAAGLLAATGVTASFMTSAATSPRR